MTVNKSYFCFQGRSLDSGRLVAVIACLFSALLFPSISFGEPTVREGVLEVHGLRIKCEGCEVRADGMCQYLLGGELMLDPCEVAVANMLKANAVSDGALREQVLGVEGLGAFLLKATLKEDAAKSLLRIYFQTDPSGFRGDKDALLNRYGKVFLNILHQIPTLRAERNDFEQRLLQEVFGWGSGRGNPEASALFVVAGHLLGVAENEILRELTVLDSKADSERLLVWAEALGELSPKQSEQYRRLSDSVQKCTSQVILEEIVGGCSREEIHAFEPAARKYLKRVQVHSLTNALAQHPPKSPASLLQMLSLAHVGEVRTPQVHELVRRALARIIENPRAELMVMRDEAVVIMLQSLAEHDSVIARAAGKLFARSAEEYWEKEEGQGALEQMVRSFKTYKYSLSQRSALLRKMRANLKVLSEQTHQATLEELAILDQGGSEEREALILLGVAGFLFFLSFVFKRRNFRAERQQLQESAGENKVALSQRQRAELRKLLMEFSLKTNATLDDLTKSYRARAKATHPDTGEGGVAEFTALREKYERAKQLMLGRKRREKAR